MSSIQPSASRRSDKKGEGAIDVSDVDRRKRDEEVWPENVYRSFDKNRDGVIDASEILDWHRQLSDFFEKALEGLK